MSLEQQCRRKPDIEGIPVKLRNGEEWLIAEAEPVPVFEKEDGQWMFKHMGVGGPFKKRFDRIHELWEKAAGKGSLPQENVEELTRLGLELSATALDQNYDLTAEHLSQLIDPTNQKMLVGILAALRGIDRSKKPEEEKEGLPEDEKKKKPSG